MRDYSLTGDEGKRAVAAGLSHTRSVYMNPISRSIYHALPALHEELKSAVPVPSTGIAAGFAELVPALLRQRNDRS